MAESTKSAQEAFRTTGKTTGGPIGASAESRGAGEASRVSGYSTEQASGRGRVGVGGRQAREGSFYGLNETWEHAMNYSRENPGKSTLIAFGVGIGVGLLMTNGITRRSRSRRIVPPVMNALSDIASALFR
jgi:hypothetical protein